MSINKYRPHILVLPEDDANRQIANGFILHSNIDECSIQILPPAKGYQRVIDQFRDNYISSMKQYSERRLVLMIDFDNQYSRRWYSLKKTIPENLRDRVFILGVLSEPEDLKRDMNVDFETIGKKLSDDCSDDTRNVWGHDLLKHNETELKRMISSVTTFLFHS